MIALPEDVALALLRGLGAYIRAAPLSDLSTGVRRFKGFRTTALARHRETILDILDEDATRALILQWLEEDKPPLDKDTHEALRIAARREDGWQEALAALSRAERPAGGPAKDPAADLKASLRKEKAKVVKLRDELKQARADQERTLADERAGRIRAEQAEADLRAELTEARERVRRAESDLARTEARAERELRRARRDAERAGARLQDVESELKDERARARSKSEVSKKKVAQTSRRSRPTRKARSGPRRQLRVPKGMLAEDPATLEAWLDRDDVYLLVDGYNVTKAESGFGNLDLETQRERLVSEVMNLAHRKTVGATIVFDGASIVRPRGKRGSVRVVFTQEGEIADDRIVGILEELPQQPVVVATNDKELRERVGELGATIATSDQLLALLR